MNVTFAQAVRGGRARRVAAAAVLVLGGIGLAGCAAGVGPGTAAVSEGQVVEESDVDAVMVDFERAGGAGQIQRASVVSVLALRPILLNVARQSGDIVGEDAVRIALDQQLPDASEQTVHFFQVQETANAMGQAGMAEFERAVQSADIHVSPRYGGDSAGGFEPAAPNWIQPSLPQGHP